MTDLAGWHARIEAAAERIRAVVLETPVSVSDALSEMAGTAVWLKHEQLQPSASFKLRGAANAMLAMSDADRAQGVVTVSTGNHARAVAHMARALDVTATVFCSRLVPEDKLRAIAELGVELRIHGVSQDEAEVAARVEAASTGARYLSPFADPDIIAGQGTLGLEIRRQVPDVRLVAVPLSGGGLAAGVALATWSAGVQVAGVSLMRGAAMIESIRAGRPIAVPETPSLADSLGGGIGLSDPQTFPLVRELVHPLLQVEEEHIRAAMRQLHEVDGVLVEGGAAVGAAAVMCGRLRHKGPIVLVLSGAGITPDRHRAVLEGAEP